MRRRRDTAAGSADLTSSGTPGSEVTSPRRRGRAAGEPGSRSDEKPGRQRAGRTRRAGAAGRPERRRSGSTARPDAASAVNLLSPWVLEELRVASLRVRFVYAALALVLVIGVAWAFLDMEAGRARTALEGEESIGSTLQAQISEMAPVRAYVSGVDARAQAVTDAMDGQLVLSEVLGGLQAALPAGASLDTTTVALPVDQAAAATGTTGTTGTTTTTDATADPSAGACPGPDPFATADVVACLEITGTAATRDDISTLVLRLGRDSRFAEPFVSATTASEGETGDGISFVGSVGLTAEVANARFADLVERLGSPDAAAAAKQARLAAKEAQATQTESAGAVAADPSTRTAADGEEQP